MMRFLAALNSVSEILNVAVVVVVLAIVVFSAGLAVLAASASASACVRRQQRETRAAQLRVAHAKRARRPLCRTCHATPDTRSNKWPNKPAEGGVTNP